MNPQSYIASGILERYVLDDLESSERLNVEELILKYPLIKNEVFEIEQAMENYASFHAISPAAWMESVILDSISKSENEQFNDFSNLPLIHKLSDVSKWRNFVSKIQMPPSKNGKVVKVLAHNEQITQMLVVSENDIEQETHVSEYESFLILEGECKCVVGSEVRFMKAGDFMSIPLHAVHHVEVLGKQVTAILQHVRV